KLIPEERNKQLQKRYYELLWRLRWWWLVVVLFGLAAVSFFLGSVEVTLDERALGGALNFREEWEAEGDAEYLSKGETKRFVYWTRPWQHRVIYLKPFGYPEMPIKIEPWTATEAHVPERFQRILLLLRPSPEMFNDVSSQITDKPYDVTL